MTDKQRPPVVGWLFAVTYLCALALIPAITFIALIHLYRTL